MFNIVVVKVKVIIVIANQTIDLEKLMMIEDPKKDKIRKGEKEEETIIEDLKEKIMTEDKDEKQKINKKEMKGGTEGKEDKEDLEKYKDSQ